MKEINRTRHLYKIGYSFGWVLFLSKTVSRTLATFLYNNIKVMKIYDHTRKLNIHLQYYVSPKTAHLKN